MIKYGPHFRKNEFRCSHCGELPHHQSLTWQVFLQNLNKLRIQVGKPFPVSSGFRCLLHPIEAQKKPDAHHAHTHGAADIRIHGENAAMVVQLALASKCFKGVGIKQNGPLEGRFIHLDDHHRNTNQQFIWSY